MTFTGRESTELLRETLSSLHNHSPDLCQHNPPGPLLSTPISQETTSRLILLPFLASPHEILIFIVD
jgi:hypothetical protein